MNPETTPEPIGPLLEDDSPHVPSVRDVADMLMERFKELRSKRVKVQVRDLIYGYAEAYGKTESELGRELALRGAAKRRKKQRGKTAEKKPREKKEPRPRERGNIRL